MLIITKESVEDLIDRLENPGELDSCQDEVRRMLEIESELLWWAESGKCCAWQASANLAGKIQLLKEVLYILEEGAIKQATPLLREYANRLYEEEAGIILS